MANKSLDKESVVIHKKVLAEIAYIAVKDIKGVYLVKDGFVSKLLRFFDKSTFDGITVRVNNNDVCLDVKVYIQYGLNIPLIAREIQDFVKKAFNKTVEVELKNINVNVAGVQRG